MTIQATCSAGGVATVEASSTTTPAVLSYTDTVNAQPAPTITTTFDGDFGSGDTIASGTTNLVVFNYTDPVGDVVSGQFSVLSTPASNDIDPCLVFGSVNEL